MTSAAPLRMEYDPFSPAFQADPFPVYRWMRDEAPVFHSEKWDWWALSRFEDVRAAALDPETFLSFEGIDIDDTAKDQSGPGFLPDIDNPRHDQIRRIVQPQLLPGRIGEREPIVRATVRRLIDAWRDRGTVDLAQELAWPMPNEVFFDLLGLPESGPDRARLERWVHELKDRKPDDARLTPVARAATAGIQSYFVDLLNERRRHPRADLVTHVVTAEIDGVPFADEHIVPASEVMGLMMVLFLGGVESTAGLTGTLFKLLAENPDQREILREHPELIPDAVEEAIRINSPLQLVGRTTSREVTLHGVTIPAGGRVVLVYGAANRDERRFPHPDRFDVTRGTQRHLGFGEGMHGCLGAPLARLEAKVALEEALPVLGDYTITDTPERYRTTPNMYVWEHLHLAFPVSSVNAAPAHHDPRGHVETVRHHTESTVVTRELETEVRVAAKEIEADGVVALTLRPVDGTPLPAWTPGAHVDLILGDGLPNRQYSLCGDVADLGAYRLGILRDAEGGGGSRHVHDRLAAGDVVRVRGPRNNFVLAPAPRYLFIAGGIGITPILPMIAAAESAGAQWRLVYGGRTRASMAFLDELARHGDRVSVRPQDETGLLDLATLLGTPEPDTLVYCCGPEPLLAAVEQHCAAWPSRALHLERFAARPLGAPVRAEAFDVELARSGFTLTVPPERSVLDVVEAAGIGVLSSCAEGTCGTCETGVLEGLPDHRDSVLTADERAANDCMLICVSRSCTARLVLDL
ncbi:cytochrome P450 [Pseudonocardia sp.]|uniref:cytochrome P450 n=1 Tax=Pseudonocardia sp. TaxID=60912 RepID=UPI003D14F48A